MTALLLVFAACLDPDARWPSPAPEGDSGAGAGADSDGSGDSGATETGLDTGDRGDTADSAPVEPLVLSVDLIEPSTGSTRGGDAVRLHGGPFIEAGLAVAFGGTAGTVVAWTGTTVDVLTPAHEKEASVDVDVTTTAGAGHAASSFAYVEPCEGITASPLTVSVGHTNSADIDITLTGCATTVSGEGDVGYSVYGAGTWYDSAISWSSLPTSVDGIAHATLHWAPQSYYVPPAGLIMEAVIRTEFGGIVITVTTT